MKLFIGGPADGQWIDTHDKDYYKIPTGVDFASVDYQMQRWHADGEQLHVFSPVGQSPSETLQLLIKHYRPNEARA